MPLTHNLALKESREIERETVLRPVGTPGGYCQSREHRQPGLSLILEGRVTWSETHICPSFLLEHIPCCLHSLVWVPGGEACYSLVVSRIQGCWRGWSWYGRLPGRRELWEGNPEAEGCIRTGWDLAESSFSQVGRRMALAGVMQSGEKWRVLG